MQIPRDALNRVGELHRQGLCLQAYSLSQTYGSLRDWEGTEARLLAARLAGHVGAPRLGMALFLLAGRQAPDDLRVQCYHVRAILSWRGPFAAWEALRARAHLETTDPMVRADWLGLHARVLGTLRDFDAAEQWLAGALEAAADHPWVQVERAALFESEDRYEDCLAAARKALDLRPWYLPGVQATAHALTLLGRDEEALDLLAQAARRLESGPLNAQLFGLEIELGRYDDARKSLRRVGDLSPLMEGDVATWLVARQADVSYYCGDFATAAEWARRVKNPFYEKFAERLAGARSDGARVLLPVGFVRQHHVTCCPATLSAIGRFWSKPAEHLSIAEEICYDGTPAYSERRWAERNGWKTREFTVTWDSALALLDRKVPFTLSTVDATRAHMQAVIGYDACRGTLLVRDPFERAIGELLAEPFFLNQRAIGPRGMALIPEEDAQLLDGLELPEAALYEQLYRLQGALFEHDRERARALYDETASGAPDHRLTLLARRSLAAYDADPATLLACHERLVELFPDDAWLQLGRLACMRDLARLDDRLALLKSLCGRPASHPVFWKQYALELTADAREHSRAVRLLRRALRCGLVDGETIHALGDIQWAQGRFDDALGLYRLAACLSDKNEALATTHFLASHHLKQTDAALRFLQGRVQRLGRLSGQPACTLFNALCLLGRAGEAFTILEEALALRPADGTLLLFGAEAHARHGQIERARELLATSEGNSKRASWLRTAAALASYRADLRAALALWKQVLEIEPLAIDAHAAVAQRLAETEGPAAALAHLEEACVRFPYNLPLHRLRYDWLRERAPSTAEAVLRHIIATHPVNAWARRELASRLGAQRRFAEAFAEAAIADSLEPRHPAHRNVHGELCALAGRTDEARKAWREAIQLSVDDAFAIEHLVASCGDADERREVLGFIRTELGRQTTYGDGLLAYKEMAPGTLSPEGCLSALQGLLEERSDLWQAWSAVGRLLLEMGRREEATNLCRKAVARFSLVPHVWLDLALVLEAGDDHAGAVDALRPALQIDPGLTEAVQLLARACIKRGEEGQAKAALEQALAREPLEARYHALLAQTLWKMGDREAAISRLVEAVRLDPDNEGQWGALSSWSAEAKRHGLPSEIARDLTGRRSGEPVCWIVLAKVLEGPGNLDERLAALDQAIRLDPVCVPAHDLKAMLLAEARRFEEARAACCPGAWGDHVPTELRGRAAWVEAASDRLEVGVALMRAVLEEEPTYYWGWTQLAEWYRAAGKNLVYLDAATHMVDLAPLEALALGYRGHAKILTANREGGKADLGRALEIAPNSAFVAQSLFDAQLEDGEYDEATQTLDRFRPHAEPERRLVMEICLAAGRRDRSSAALALGELCLCVTPDFWPFETAAEAVTRAGWGDTLEVVLKKAMGDPAANAHIGALWADCSARWKRWGECERRLKSLDPSSAMARRFILAYAAALARGGERNRLRRLVRQHGAAARGDNQTWGDIGSHLVAVNECPSAAQWLADWRERRELEPWMLINLVVALRRLGRDQDAERVCEAALALPADRTTPFHRVWMAFTQALSGHARGAADLVRDVSEAALPSYYRFVHSLTQAMLAVQQSATGERRRVFRSARDQLRRSRALSPNYRKIPELRRAYVETVWRISGDVRDLSAMSWRLWRWLAG